MNVSREDTHSGSQVFQRQLQSNVMNKISDSTVGKRSQRLLSSPSGSYQDIFVEQFINDRDKLVLKLRRKDMSRSDE